MSRRRGGSPRWRRNQRLKCLCGGYHFPHRRAGGACDHSPTRDIHLAKRSGEQADVDNAILALAEKRAKTYKPGADCPF